MITEAPLKSPCITAIFVMLRPTKDSFTTHTIFFTQLADRVTRLYSHVFTTYRFYITQLFDSYDGCFTMWIPTSGCPSLSCLNHPRGRRRPRRSRTGAGSLADATAVGSSPSSRGRPKDGGSEEGGMEMESVTDVTQVVLAVSMVTMLTSAGQKPLLFRRTVGALGGTWR